MNGPSIEALERLLAAGKDGALLRVGLGNAYAQAGQAERAILHLRTAVTLDPAYSAAWKFLGRELARAERAEEALAAYREGIAAASRKGDKQSMKEMEVFARRIVKAMDAGGSKI